MRTVSEGLGSMPNAEGYTNANQRKCYTNANQRKCKHTGRRLGTELGGEIWSADKIGAEMSSIEGASNIISYR